MSEFYQRTRRVRLKNSGTFDKKSSRKFRYNEIPRAHLEEMEERRKVDQKTQQNMPDDHGVQKVQQTGRQQTTMEMKIIAHMHSDFPEKFGIPRQSGLVNSLQSMIVFEPEYRNPHAFRGLEGYSHIWILWEFSEAVRADWSPTVLPPRLGGKTRMGVFATRSPFRPNPIGLSCVQLEKIAQHPKFGPVLYVSGADLMDGTPIFDVKPYLPYTDSRPEATDGFAGTVFDHHLDVVFPEELLDWFPEDKRKAAIEILEQDPRPAYQEDPERRYGTSFAGYDIRFHVRDGVLTVCEVVPLR